MSLTSSTISTAADSTLAPVSTTVTATSETTPTTTNKPKVETKHAAVEEPKHATAPEDGQDDDGETQDENAENEDAFGAEEEEEDNAVEEEDQEPSGLATSLSSSTTSTSSRTEPRVLEEVAKIEAKIPKIPNSVQRNGTGKKPSPSSSAVMATTMATVTTSTPLAVETEEEEEPLDAESGEDQVEEDETLDAESEEEEDDDEEDEEEDPTVAIFNLSDGKVESIDRGTLGLVDANETLQKIADGNRHLDEDATIVRYAFQLIRGCNPVFLLDVKPIELAMLKSFCQRTGLKQVSKLIQKTHESIMDPERYDNVSAAFLSNLRKTKTAVETDDALVNQINGESFSQWWADYFARHRRYAQETDAFYKNTETSYNDWKETIVGVSLGVHFAPTPVVPKESIALKNNKVDLHERATVPIEAIPVPSAANAANVSVERPTTVASAAILARKRRNEAREAKQKVLAEQQQQQPQQPQHPQQPQPAAVSVEATAETSTEVKDEQPSSEETQAEKRRMQLTNARELRHAEQQKRRKAAAAAGPKKDLGHSEEDKTEQTPQQQPPPPQRQAPRNVPHGPADRASAPIRPVSVNQPQTQQPQQKPAPTNLARRPPPTAASHGRATAAAASVQAPAQATNPLSGLLDRFKQQPANAAVPVATSRPPPRAAPRNHQ